MKILLMTTPRPEQGDSPLHFGCGRPPQGLGFISAFLELNGHEVEIVDLYTFGGEGIVGDSTKIQNIPMQLDIDLDYKIKSFKPDIIGMHISTLTHLNAYDLADRLAIDYPEIVLVCGGPHVTLFPEEVPSSFTYAVTGAGEFPMLSIANSSPLAGKFSRNSVFILDGGCIPKSIIDTMPFPDYGNFIDKPYNYGLEEFGLEGKSLILNTSRGCPYKCKFCAGIHVHPRYTSFSAWSVVTEMIKLHRNYRVDTFYFREDNFTASLDRVELFCNLLLLVSNKYKFKWVCESRAKGLTEDLIKLMAEAGCKGLYIGCESGSDRILAEMNKRETVADYRRVLPLLKENGINTYTTWMYGYPGETGHDAMLTERLIAELQPTSADRFIFIGIPTSTIYDKLNESGDYEFKDKYGFIFPHGYYDRATALYGKNDPKVKYVREAYGDGLYSS